jgi:uncharacterized protein YutE (UPF0331/DUF86 family)
LVDAESIEARLSRLGQRLAQLEEIRDGGEDAYRGDFRTRLAAQHGLQLAIQTCIDIGAHLIAEHNLEMPSDYRAVFASLVALELDPGLAERLGRAAGMRNILVHDYLEVDDRLVWEALVDLGDLRDFGAYAAGLLD